MSNWYLISNRLPFTYNEKTGKISQSSGGLVTALNGIKGIKNLHWIGVIDEAFPKEELKKLNEKSSIQFDGRGLTQKPMIITTMDFAMMFFGRYSITKQKG